MESRANFDDYEIIEPIGIGGHSIVFKAIDKKTGQEVALNSYYFPIPFKSNLEISQIMDDNHEPFLICSASATFAADLIDIENNYAYTPLYVAPERYSDKYEEYIFHPMFFHMQSFFMDCFR